MSLTVPDPGSVPSGFSITSQVHTTEFDEQGRPFGQWKVSFRTPSGIDSFVVIADAYYTAANIAELIGAKVTEIERVQALGAPSGGQ